MVNSFLPRFRDRFRLSKPDYLWWAIVIPGTILRLRQYFSNRSLWADEASLAYNLANRTFSGLTQSLDFEQGAPIGFLFIEKLLVVAFGNVDQVMRLFPLFSGIASVYLIYRIAQAHITGGWFAGLLFAISWYPIYYSSELKQYSSDVMMCLLAVFLASRCLRAGATSRDFLILGIGGAISIWVSHPSAFILAGIGSALFIAAITRTRAIPIAWLAGLGIVWAASFGTEYLVSLRHLIADDYLQDYWRNAFLPFPPWRNLGWLLKTYFSLLLMTLNTTDQILVFAVPILGLIGGLSLLYRDRIIAILVISPFLIALIASALQKYPLKDRFMLFLVPFVLILITEGLGSIYRFVARWHAGVARVVVAFPALALFFLPVGNTFQLFLSPYNKSDIKPIIAYVAEHRQVDETIYVYHSSEPAFAYYAPLYDIGAGEILIGYDTPRKRTAFQGFIQDIKSLRGRDRVWFIFSDINDCGGCNGDMQAYYEQYLNDFGILLGSVHANGASAYLYDFNP